MAHPVEVQKISREIWILDISSVSHHRMSQYLPRLLTCDRSDSLVI